MRRMLLSAFAALLAPLMITASVAAWSPLSNIDCGQASGSAVCADGRNTKNPVTGVNGLFLKIANIVALVAGIAAVIIIVLAGLRFVTSGGSSEDVAGARRTIIYASVGLIIIVLGRALIGLVLSRL